MARFADAVWVPSDAVTVAANPLVSRYSTPAERASAGTVTVAGSDPAVGGETERLTTVPPGGAGRSRWIDSAMVSDGQTVAFAGVTVARFATSVGPRTRTVAVWLTPASVAVRVTAEDGELPLR